MDTKRDSIPDISWADIRRTIPERISEICKEYPQFPLYAWFYNDQWWSVDSSLIRYSPTLSSERSLLWEKTKVRRDDQEQSFKGRKRRLRRQP